MSITIEKTSIRIPSEDPTEKVVTEGGSSVPEAHVPGVQWLPVEFLNGMRIAWNWDDLLQDATTAGENRNSAFHPGRFMVGSCKRVT